MPFYMILQSKGSESDYRINKKLPCIGQNYAFCRICPAARRTLYEAQSKLDYVPKKTPIYRCSYTRNDETEPCYKSEIPESSLNQAVFDIISKQAEIILNIDDVSKADTAQIKTGQLADIEKQIVACQKEKQKLYEHLLTEKILLMNIGS